jgi:drug/metabolite transporter (DMT)-like permease
MIACIDGGRQRESMRALNREGAALPNGMGGVKQTMGPAEWGLLLLLALVWGGSFFFAEIAVAEWPPLTVVLGRVLLGALLLIGLVRLSGRRLPADRQTWGALIVLGLLNSALPFCLIVWGQTRIDSGLASILYATTSLFTVLLAPVFTTDERLTPPRLLGVLVGLTGVVIMIGPEALADAGGTMLAKLAILGGALSYALGSIWARRFRGLPSPVIAACQLSVAAMVMLPVALIVDRPWTLPPPSPRVVAGIVGLAVLSTLVGYLLYFTLLARAGAVNVSLVTLLVPPSALLLGTFGLHERIAPRDLLGLACIALGLAAIDGRPLRRLWRGAESRSLAK